MTSRVGVMGGTFDPIHVGHLVAASEVADELGLSKVIFVPTGRPWQKAAEQVSAAELRYVMTVLATADDPRFTVSRVDIDRPGPTYAVDTLTDLRADVGSDAELLFIAGADAVAGMGSWYRSEEVFSLATVVAVTRPGHNVPLAARLPAAVVAVEVTGVAVSSTMCRRRVAAGRSLDYLVPRPVAAYIAKTGLYRA